ncbi:hypothetical protein B0E51_01175 [Rhodanobacter sp. C05]|nr:hypothetical protein B0E51_01175 [Rhodanobacter sp. C05]
MVLQSEVYQHNKQFAIRTVAKAEAVPSEFVNVVCFSADTVAQDFGGRSSDSEWEIIVLLAAQAQHEPMHPLSMARSLLEIPDGVEAKYTAREFAESVLYWSQRVQVNGGDES